MRNTGKNLLLYNFAKRHKFGIATAILISIGFITGVLFWKSSEIRQLEKPLMDGQPINYWLQRMAAGDGRDEIRDRLVSIGPGVTAPLLAALHDNDKPSPLRMKLARLVVGRFPKVARWLWGQRSQRWMAAYTLAEMPPDPKIRDALIRVLAEASNKEEDSNIGFFAVEGLTERYTNDAAIVVPCLRRALGLPHNNIQAAAARALPRFASHAYEAIPDLIFLTRVTDPEVADHAAAALGEFGPVASNALPALGSMLTNTEPALRRQAAVARWKIAPWLGFPEDILRWNMENAKLEERWLAAYQLWKLDHSRREEAIQTLLAVIQSVPDTTDNGQPFHGPRWGAAEALGRMGTDAAAALPTLLLIAKDDTDEPMRRFATNACEQIKRAVSELQRAKEGTN